MLNCPALTLKISDIKQLQSLFEQERSKGNVQETKKLKLKLEQSLKELESVLFQEEQSFLLTDIYKQWSFNADQLKKAEKNTEHPQIINPREVNYTDKEIINTELMGEYSLNPECIGIDWGKKIQQNKIKIIDIQDEIQSLPNKKLSTIAEYLTNKYSETHIIPDLTLYQYLIQNENNPKTNKLLTPFKDSSIYSFTFGSLLRDQNGHSNVPYVRWSGSRFRRDGRWLGGGWGSGGRVLLLER